MEFINRINAQIVNPIIVLMVGVAVVVFLYGLVEFLAKKDSASGNRKELYSKMIWGIVGLAIMVSVFGIMQFIINTMQGLGGN
ncbi:MAG: hypothetical protein WCV68_03345 [Candidatus Paceibacterota bacterium]|jgi:uncharacterized membrane protein YidH (DUF202 family)